MPGCLPLMSNMPLSSLSKDPNLGRAFLALEGLQVWCHCDMEPEEEFQTFGGEGAVQMLACLVLSFFMPR